MLSASLTVFLPRESDGYRDHRVLDALRMVPNGARVTVVVGSRCDTTTSAVADLREAARRVHVEISGTSAGAIESWLQAVSGRRM